MTGRGEAVKHIRVLLAFCLLLPLMGAETPAVRADGSWGCYPYISHPPMPISKGSTVTCEAGLGRGARFSVTWTATGFTPATSTRASQRFTPTGLGSASIRGVLVFAGTRNVETWDYRVVAPPKAGFVARWVSGTDVSFDSAPSDNAQRVQWDFGDGSGRASGKAPTHSFPAKGEYAVSLTVWNAAGDSDAFRARVAVDPIRTYAPVLRFHPDETHFPLNADAFIAVSTLRWNHDGCPPTEKATQGSVDASWLGRGEYHARLARSALAGIHACELYGDGYKSSQRTAPYNHVDGTMNDEIAEGFYLDLDDSQRGGDLGSARSYFQAKGDSIAYWVSYGYNSWSDDHEGDWEHVVVELDARDALRRVVFYHHNCNEALTRDELKDGARGSGFRQGTFQPIVWVAKGSHGSYWREATFPDASRCQIGIDETRSGGQTWDTSGSLQSLTSRPWYGYGGAWGQPGRSKYWSGPIGWGQ
jgi:hypothetical protein